VPKNRHPEREPGVRRKAYTVVIALAFFVCLGGLPKILSSLHLKINAAPPTSSNGIRLLGAPEAPEAVPLPPVARPVDPTQPTATFPPVSESQEAAAVTNEDNRLRTMLHDSFRTFLPKLIPHRGSLPTLLLTSGSHYVYGGGFRYLVTGQSTYTAADLVRGGAMVRLPNGGALLEDNVFVAAGVHLDLSSSDVGAIYLDSTPRGSASIVAWGGSLDFRGTSQHPLAIRGWDEATMTPATDIGNGRPYVREVAGRMTFENARVSSLGFWSGRTGGVAWTGLSTHTSFGAAVATTFTGNTYGAFVTRGRNVRFSADLFESNQLDGLNVHRGSIGTAVTFSSAVRNGANGFHVGRATARTFLQHDVSQHNATNGFLVDGRPLVSTASASGAGVAPGQGTRIENSAALGNGRTGILIEGGNGTVLKADEVCSRLTGIALRLGASNAIVDGNDVRCGPRTGLRIGPLAPGALVFGNAVSGARIAVLVVSPGGSVEIDKSLITLASVFGISVRGVNSPVSGKDNVISGIGFRAVDSRAEARPPALSGSNTANWAYARHGTILTYLQFHPLALLWLSIAFLVIAGMLWTRRRRPPPHPYPESTRWAWSEDELDEAAPILVGASAGARGGSASAGARGGSASAGARNGSAPAGAQAGPPWSQDDDAWPPDDEAVYRGPFEALLPEAVHLDAAAPGSRRLDDPRLDAAVPGSRRLDAGRSDDERPDGDRRDSDRRDGERRDGERLGRRRDDEQLGRRRDDEQLGRRRDDEQLGRRRDGGRRDDEQRDPGRLDGDRHDGDRHDGDRHGERRDPARLDGERRDGGRRDGGRRDGGRRDGERRDGERRERARRDPARRDGERHGPARLDSAQSDDAERREDARAHVGHSDEHRQPSRHSRPEPIDATKPLPQVIDK
jgi:hypothetical protein